MADARISELGAAGALDGSELVEVVKAGVNVQSTTQDIADLGSGSGHSIEDEGTPLTQRADLNFVGAGVTAADSGGKTVITIPGGGHTIEEEGTPLTQRTKLNFVGAGVTVTDDSGDDASVVTIPSGSGIGAQDLFITGPAFWPKATNGSEFAMSFEVGGTATLMSLDFDASSDENAQFQVSLPRNWNNGTVTATVYWTATAGTPGETVQWEIKAVAFSNDDPLSGAFGTAVAIDDTLIATSDVHISPTSSAITIAGTPADGDLVLFNIMRDVSDDTLAADAKLLGVRITLTLDASTSE